MFFLFFAMVCAVTTPKQAFLASEAVFTGIVISVEQSPDRIDTLVNLRVTRAWKGRPSRITTLRLSPGFDDGSIEWKQGQEFLIYTTLDRDKKSLTTSSCLRTALVKYAAEDLKFLGPSRKP